MLPSGESAQFLGILDLLPECPIYKPIYLDFWFGVGKHEYDLISLAPKFLGKPIRLPFLGEINSIGSLIVPWQFVGWVAGYYKKYFRKCESPPLPHLVQYVVYVFKNSFF